MYILLCATILDIISTIFAYVLSRYTPHETARALQQVPQHLTVLEPMGSFSRRQLLLLALCLMALSNEHEKPSQLARNIEIFAIFAWLVLTLDCRR